MCPLSPTEGIVESTVVESIAAVIMHCPDEVWLIRDAGLERPSFGARVAMPRLLG